MLNVVFLGSGALGLRVLIDVREVCHVRAVLTDNKSKSIIDFCMSAGMPIFKGNPRSGKAEPFLRQCSCDVLLSVNYLYIVEQDLIQLPKRYAINFHGSLLPKYRGRTPHVWAIINGEQETGITAHLMDNEVDHGPILKQRRIPISADDTGGKILDKFQEQYPDLVRELLQQIEGKLIKPVPQDHNKATCFGKRVPEDGLIEWHWFRERIRNWIRAQARPYPGAFTFYHGEKIIINHASFSDRGFDSGIGNGTILDVEEDSIFVKTPNGVLELSEMEYEKNIHFEKGAILK
jgi:methionyl-tRNA formyltransferase